MLNIAILMGRLVADPELRYTPNNVTVTSFAIAVDRSYVKPGDERQADFIDIVAWRHTAEFVCKYFRKGQMIALQGSIQTRSYTDNNGIKRKAFEIVADNVHFADSKRDNTATQPAPSEPRQPQQPAAQPAPAVPTPYHEQETFQDINFVPADDLPF